VVNWRQMLRESAASLNHYRRRSLVTIISLAWGVASFIILMSYGDGFKKTLVDGFEAVGQDLIIMSQGQTSLQAGGMRAGRRILLDLEDVEAIREAVPLVRAISPERMIGSIQVIRGTREKEFGLRGVWPEYHIIRNIRMAEGRWISADDNRQRNRVAVLGAMVARQLFSGIPPVGEEITVGGMRFTVIGVMDSKAQFANYNRQDNECIFVPYNAMALFGDIRHPNFIVWTPVAGTLREDAIRMVRATLASLHRFNPRDDKAVFILAFSQFRHIIDGMTLAAKVLLGFVGALTLGIGGVGLANIMLTSVIDRTREIGVLKAIGGPPARHPRPVSAGGAVDRSGRRRDRHSRRGRGGELDRRDADVRVYAGKPGRQRRLSDGALGFVDSGLHGRVDCRGPDRRHDSGDSRRPAGPHRSPAL
jgi:putative ABC transport system permease protein